MDVAVLKRDIRQGEVYEHTGDLRIEGNVSGGEVRITNGSLHITGSVAPLSGISARQSLAAPGQDSPCNIRIDQKIGEGVGIIADGETTLLQDADKFVVVISKHGINGHKFGMGAELKATHGKVNAESVDGMSAITAENATVLNIGDLCEVSVVNRFDAQYVGESCNVEAKIHCIDKAHSTATVSGTPTQKSPDRSDRLHSTGATLQA